MTDLTRLLITLALAPPVVAAIAVLWQTIARSIALARGVVDSPPHQCGWDGCCCETGGKD